MPPLALLSFSSLSAPKIKCSFREKNIARIPQGPTAVRDLWTCVLQWHTENWNPEQWGTFPFTVPPSCAFWGWNAAGRCFSSSSPLQGSGGSILSQNYCLWMPFGHPKPEALKITVFFTNYRTEAFTAISRVCISPKAATTKHVKHKMHVPPWNGEKFPIKTATHTSSAECTFLLLSFLFII